MKLKCLQRRRLILEVEIERRHSAEKGFYFTLSMNRVIAKGGVGLLQQCDLVIAQLKILNRTQQLESRLTKLRRK